MKILGLDPGKVNFAWVLYQDGPQAHGWVTPMPDVNNDAEFINGYIELLARLNPDYIVLERFMVRNRGQSIHAESINQMIGRVAILSRTFAGRDIIQLTAAQWKVWHQRQGRDLEVVYAHLPSVHLRDAAGIAEYAAKEFIPKRGV